MSGPGMIFQGAARRAPFNAADGWPDSLTAEQLARLQRPHDDTKEGSTRALPLQRDFYRLADAAMKCGELLAVAVQRAKLGRLPVATGGVGFVTGRPTMRVTQSKESIEVQAVRASVAAAWMATPAINEEPSIYLAAWFQAKGVTAPQVGAGETAIVDAGGTVKAKSGRKPGNQGDLLATIIDALDAYAKERNIAFDRRAMPGQVGECDIEGSFHWLCAKLNQYEFLKGKKAFAGYWARRCTFPPYPKPSDFYLNALPHIAQTLGVKLNISNLSVTRREAS